MRKKSINRKLKFAANMPPLYHTLPGEKYHYSKSEVLDWLSKRPMLIEYIYEQASNAGLIIYDSATGIWTGVEYDGD
ncbi:MAG TPA: hypothetical protein DG757_26415 [Bacillus sp. (in: Bacteria)]|nr:hypothetical protein [Bacillus sp. (in: firmicutes)]